jgi:hypothetical protein
VAVLTAFDAGVRLLMVVLKVGALRDWVWELLVDAHLGAIFVMDVVTALIAWVTLQTFTGVFFAFLAISTAEQTFLFGRIVVLQKTAIRNEFAHARIIHPSLEGAIFVG